MMILLVYADDMMMIWLDSDDWYDDMMIWWYIDMMNIYDMIIILMLDMYMMVWYDMIWYDAPCRLAILWHICLDDTDDMMIWYDMHDDMMIWYDIMMIWPMYDMTDDWYDMIW
jgi:hypothetical protein